MPKYNFPDTLDSRFKDIEQRLHILETSARTGLSFLRWCKSTASAPPAVFGTNEYGTAGNTWVDDAGQTGTGYPTITMRVPNRFLVIATYRAYDVANNAAYRSKSVQVNVKIDSSAGYLNREVYQGNAAEMDVPVVAIEVLGSGDPATGLHTFTLGATWDDTYPAAGTLPQLADSQLLILPLSAA